MVYKIVIDPKAITDIQSAINYYEEQQSDLGGKFLKVLNKHFQALENKPFFRIRYDNVHCLPLKKFPYMVHFTISEEKQLVTIRAIFHTSRNPVFWKLNL